MSLNKIVKIISLNVETIAVSHIAPFTYMMDAASFGRVKTSNDPCEFLRPNEPINSSHLDFRVPEFFQLETSTYGKTEPVYIVADPEVERYFGMTMNMLITGRQLAERESKEALSKVKSLQANSSYWNCVYVKGEDKLQTLTKRHNILFKSFMVSCVVSLGLLSTLIYQFFA